MLFYFYFLKGISGYLLNFQTGSLNFKGVFTEQIHTHTPYIYVYGIYTYIHIYHIYTMHIPYIYHVYTTYIPYIWYIHVVIHI